MRARIAASPNFTARMAGFSWLMTFVFGMVALVASRRVLMPKEWSITANLLATVFYISATLFIYELLKPVNRSFSLLAAFFSLTGCSIGALSAAIQSNNRQAANISFLFFGLHCLIVGLLILRSAFLPRIVGALMVFAGLGWLTSCFANLLSPPLARALSIYIMLPGMLGEASLTLWLLVKGVNVERWKDVA